LQVKGNWTEVTGVPTIRIFLQHRSLACTARTHHSTLFRFLVPRKSLLETCENNTSVTAKTSVRAWRWLSLAGHGHRKHLTSLFVTSVFKASQPFQIELYWIPYYSYEPKWHVLLLYITDKIENIYHYKLFK
jgi:hypothetical protein